MNKQTFTIPEGCKVISVEEVGNQIITTFEPEIKRGDVIYCEDNDGFNWVFILKEKINREFNPYDYFCVFTSAGMIKISGCCRHPNKVFRHATPEEAQCIWCALTKQGKKWNPETMQVEEIKKDRWRAENGEIYYYIYRNTYTSTFIENGNDVDNKHYKHGNYFRTREQAERAMPYLQKAFDEFWKKELE